MEQNSHILKETHRMFQWESFRQSLIFHESSRWASLDHLLVFGESVVVDHCGGQWCISGPDPVMETTSSMNKVGPLIFSLLVHVSIAQVTDTRVCEIHVYGDIFRRNAPCS